MKLTNLLKMSINIKDNLSLISTKLLTAYESADPSMRAPQLPRLVAVSKTKPKELIIEAYQSGHRHFGENYIQEIVEKSSDPEILEHCPDINWHFIGACQSNKAKDLMKCPRLHSIETITSTKLAAKINNLAGELKKKVTVFVQVNTSGEENKNGLLPGDEVVKATKFILETCPNIKFGGLMTIGNLGNSLATTREPGEENPDFRSLIEMRKRLNEETKLDLDMVEMSMGMSNDFEEAIMMGSTNIRVGSSIFGARTYPPSSGIEVSATETSIGAKGGGSNVQVEKVNSAMAKMTM